MQDICLSVTQEGDRVDWRRLRARFPYFASNADTIYLDSAATTQKPDVVLESAYRTLSVNCANAGRGVYRSATRLASDVEEAREKVRRFLNAAGDDLVLFTSGASESLRVVGEILAPRALEAGDEVLLCEEDHRASVLPLKNAVAELARRGKHVSIETLDVRRHGAIDIDALAGRLGAKSRLVSLTHIHNVFGNDLRVDRLRGSLPARTLVSLDASQSVGHIPVDVRELPIDFLSFSAHKMFGLPGTGILWVRAAIADELELRGRSTGLRAALDLQDYLEHKTLNIPGIVALGAAIDFIEGIGVDSMSERLAVLTQRLLRGLRSIGVIQFLPGAAHWACPCGHGILSFRIPRIRSSDVGFILDAEGICVRTGTHCMWSGSRSEESIRVSMHVYNTEDEVDRFVGVLSDICEGDEGGEQTW